MIKEIKSGMWIISPNGQPFKVIREEEKKLWCGSKNSTECVVVIGSIDNIAQEVIIQKKDMEHYVDITSALVNIMDKYRDIVGEQDDSVIGIERENRTLTINLDKALEEIEIFKKAITVANESIKEKQTIIDDFEGSSADIRKSVQNRGVEDIRKAYGNKITNDDL